ncbi:MAG: CPBP family intramembrane glutamic endopeptidase [Terriglobia bacterium]
MIPRPKAPLPSVSATRLDYYDTTWFLFMAAIVALAIRLSVKARWLSPACLTQRSLALQGLGLGMLILTSVLIARIRGRRSPAAELGWRIPRPSYLVIAVAGGTGMALAVVITVWRTSPLVPKMGLGEGVILAVVRTPLLEESLFRGCLLPAVAGSVGLPGAVVITSLVFALSHHPPTVLQCVCFTLAGMLYAWMRVASQSTAAATLMHASYNLVLLGCATFALH